MKRFVATVSFASLLILIIFSCKQKDSIKGYIEKGFAKPEIAGDARFTVQNEGDEGKLYVPSEEDVEVEFSIKNTYEQELIGKVQLPNEKKVLFNKEPEVKILNLTQMVIAFNFKKEAEPSILNDFMGESVKLTINLYEKKTGRHLSKRILQTTCNTPPLPVAKEKIIYNEAKDEYIVTLPKNQGKHQDLRDVKFLLSGDYQSEHVKPKVVSIEDVGEQGIEIKLAIKGSENWQLKKPFGSRSIKAFVYDKAGLESSETGNVATRFLANITLVPSSIELSIATADDEGIPVPAIKELQDFFSNDDWKDAGYNIEYIGEGFSYDEATKRLKKSNIGVGSYNITVTLKQGGGNPVTATYTVNIVGKNEAGINQSALAIIDASNYATLSPNFKCNPLNFFGKTIEFTGEGSTPKTGRFIVPYTGFDTKLKIHIEAISQKSKVQNEHEEGKDNKKDFEVELKSGSGETTTLTFYILAEDGNTKRKYVITFERGDSVKVELKLDHDLLTSANHNGSASIHWDYGKREIKSSDAEQTQEMRVAKATEVNFNIMAGENAKIAKCQSSDPSNIVAIGGSGGESSIILPQDFRLEVTLKAMSSVLWKNYKTPQDNCGYTSGKITYYKNKTEQHTIDLANLSQDRRRAVQNGKSCTFTVEGLKSNFKVQSWRVNNVVVQENNSSYILSRNKTSLTIVNASGDYTVEVQTIKLCSINIQMGTKNGENFTPITSDVAKYSFKATKNTEDGELLDKDSLDKFKFINIPVFSNVVITAIQEDKTPYHVEKWELQSAPNTNFIDISDSNKLSKKISVYDDTILRVVLKRRHTVTVSIIRDDGTNPNHNYKVEASDLVGHATYESEPQANPSLPQDTFIFKNIPYGIEIKLVAFSEGTKIYTIQEWKYKNEHDIFQSFEINKYLGSSFYDKSTVKWEVLEDCKLEVHLKSIP